MCGIAGWYGREPRLPAERHDIHQALAHRGPDGQGFYANPGVCLYHSRLSVIDVAGGAQPLISEDGRYALVANGEIYNYLELRAELEQAGARFRTRSDSEVILAGYAIWGTDVLTRLEGMYAFALHDVIGDELLLARDPLGMKPLFFSRQPFGTAFASEVKALLPMLPAAPSVNAPALAQFMETQHSLGRQTLFEGVERLLPGEAMLLRAGAEHRRWLHWELPDVSQAPADDPAAALDELMETVFTQHLRSDVPIGLFLSGGIDSTILLGLMRRYGVNDIHTFSLGFPDSSVGDELAVASRIAQHFGTRHEVITPDPQTLLNRFVDTVWAADELMRDWANLPTSLLAESASQQLKVVFSGEGGDEVFAGYGRYRIGAAEQGVKALLYPGTGGFRARGDLRGGQVRRLLSPALVDAHRRWREPRIERWQSYPRQWTLLQKMQALDLQFALPDNLLVKADRMLMSQGVEGRLPFVDRRIVTFGLSLPDALKRDNRIGKKLLRDWAGGFMPTDHFAAPKRGFHVPIRDWWRGERLTMLRQTLLADPAVVHWFRPEGIDELIKRQARKGDAARLLMTVLQFAIWHRLFIDGDGSRPPASVDPLDFLGQSRA